MRAPAETQVTGTCGFAELSPRALGVMGTKCAGFEGIRTPENHFRGSHGHSPRWQTQQWSTVASCPSTTSTPRAHPFRYDSPQ